MVIRKKSIIDKSIKGEVAFENTKSAFDYMSLVIESVVMAYSSIEAFANEQISDDHEYWSNRKSKEILLCSEKKEIERFFPLDEKMTDVLPQILGVKTPKHGTSRVWQIHKKLKKMRDEIIHMKADDRKSSGPEIQTIWDRLVVIEPPHKTAKKMIEHYYKGKTKRHVG